MFQKNSDSCTQLHISVRNLVEFIFREGDIDNRAGRMPGTEAMQEGTRIHRKIQKGMGDSYQAEVPLSYTEQRKLYQLTIEGRADGIFMEGINHTPDGISFQIEGINHVQYGIPFQIEGINQMLDPFHIAGMERLADGETLPDSLTWIDEIKGIYRRLDTLEKPVYVHKAQAMCYAYMFACQKGLDWIGVQITYCNLDTEDKKYFREVFSFRQLREWFENLVSQYRKWADFQCEWKQKRQESIHQLEFPFAYRKGQHKLAGDVYRTILREKNLFLQAPTGVGKTISTIFPAVKAVGEELADRIFYLTAKTITATVAKDTFQLLREQGYQGKIIQITAKEKLCMCEEMECNPVHCPYARGHFNRVNDAVYDLLQKSDLFTREEILEQAEKFQVCPFEMGLDVASFADDIVCDYNYAFDPNVYLKRFFQEGIKGDYIFLVDEAHNLVDRAREMYSAQICKEHVLAAKKIFRKYHKQIERQLEKCNKILLEWKRECETYRIFDNTGNLYFALSRLMSEMDEFLQKPIEFPERKEILDFYFEVRNFINIYELVDENYVVYSRIQEDGSFIVRLFCVDPSENLQKCMDRARSTIFFSATLLPIRYYKSILSTREDDYAIYAQSTFSPKQWLLLFGGDVSTRYSRRNQEEFTRIAAYIDRTVHCKKGNYIAFFPSYKLMEQVYDIFLQTQEEYQTVSFGRGSADGSDHRRKKPCRSAIQNQNMKETEREAFLAEFETEQETSFVAFCVMGGIFGEGIDLKNDRLIGAIVVGTGLPQISDEREILKNYFDEQSQNGFDYAFRFPGMNKVLQAAGRVIRTVEDRGVILLLDDRFLSGDYEILYPREWEQREYCTLNTVEEHLQRFWSGNSVPSGEV